MLSMHAPAEGDSRDSPSDLASGAATPLPWALPTRSVQGGELEIPDGVTVDIEGSFVFSNVHFRGVPRDACSAHVILSMYLNDFVLASLMSTRLIRLCCAFKHVGIRLC